MAGQTGAHGRNVWDDTLTPPRRRCTANRRGTDTRCLKRPIPGGTVCRNHGAAAPQTRKAARRRLLEAVDPALDALIVPLEVASRIAAREMARSEHGYVSPGTLELLVELRAQANDVLDRTGYPRATDVNVADGRERLLERIREETGR